ncbi:hypothetical protein MK079_04565 [Candidatus Gracilibacteria bacterium]|nr:hypothetical protein [Candidatus Gracilibacteria bacterium]
MKGGHTYIFRLSLGALVFGALFFQTFSYLVPTISSAVAGRWGSQYTWEPQRIPGPSDIVQIDREIDIEWYYDNGDIVTDIVIGGLLTSSGAIFHVPSYTFPTREMSVTVEGDVENEGLISGFDFDTYFYQNEDFLRDQYYFEYVQRYGEDSYYSFYNFIQNDIYRSLGDTFLDLEIRGDLFNDGNIQTFDEFDLYGSITQTPEGNIVGDVDIQGLDARPVRSFSGSFSRDTNLYLMGDMTLSGGLDLAGDIRLQNNTLFVDGTQNIFVDNLQQGSVLSSNNSDVEDEKIQTSDMSSITTDIDQVEFVDNARVRGDIFLAGDVSFSGGVSFSSFAEVYLAGHTLSITEENTIPLGWDMIPYAVSYDVYFNDVLTAGTQNNRYIFDPQNRPTGEYEWYVRGVYADGTFSEPSIVSTIYLTNSSVISVPIPTQLTQSIESPLLEREDLAVGEQIGRFQSGSGIILSASLAEGNTLPVKMRAELTNIESGTIEIFESDEMAAHGILEITVPYSATGSFAWRVQFEDGSENVSEWVEFGDNLSTQSDFSIFAGFEPYPYGYSFYNTFPRSDLLSGGVTNWTITDPFNFENPTIIDGDKWEILENVFDLSQMQDDRQKIALFESLKLDDGSVFQGGSCYGMASSAAMYRAHPDFLIEDHLDLITEIDGGTIFDDVEELQLDNRQWDEYNPALEAILSFQLFNIV